MSIIVLIFFVRDLTDCKNTSNTARNIARLTAGSVSKRIITKLCQYVVIDEKSENIKEKKLRNPDWLKSDKSIFKDGTNPNIDAANVMEKIIILLKTKMRSSL